MDLLLGLLFSAVGGVYMFYGKKQHDPMFLVVGFALAIYPYFVSNVVLMILVGVVLTAVPVAHQKGWF